MSTASTPERAAPAPFGTAGDASRDEPRAGFGALAAAEWIKLRSLRSTYAVLLTGALAIIAICANSARSNVHLIETNGTEEQRQAIDPMNAPFIPDAYLILLIVCGAVGAMAVAGEFGSGSIRTTFAAVPARRQVIAAKAAVVTAVTLVFGTVVAVSSFALTQAIFHQVRIGLPFDAPGAPRAIAATALLAPLSALVGLGLGALVRHGAGAVMAVVGVLAVLPRFFMGETYRWVKEIGNAMPLPAWSALVENPRPHHVAVPVRYPVESGEAWIVFGAWTLAAVVVAVLVVQRRDV
ncbi:ABC transporter permease subunit [Actinomadura vinacea]|uniref:ABC transporter permease subunit n=1 Tax=Actinomadura vinacea TaxID=115336 RepID=A0ABN3JV71_9ACTN